MPVALAASGAYQKRGHLDWRVMAWSVSIGAPATVGGALLTPYVGGRLLVQATEGVVAAIGLRLAAFPHEPREHAAEARTPRTRVITIAAVVGLFSGLLANSGGFLLTPLCLVILHLPIKRALATSLAVSAALAVPGTVTHAALGHIDWLVVLVYAIPATPAAYLGARLAIRLSPDRLTRLYGAVLVTLAAALLISRR